MKVEELDMFDDEVQMNISKGLAEGMEKNADNIAKEEQLIRDSNQPLGRIVPEEEQEKLNTVTASFVKNVSQIRERASRLKKME